MSGQSATGTPLNIYLPLFKIVQRPLVPIEDSWIDAAPLVILFGMLLFAMWASRNLKRPQLARRISQCVGLFVFVIFFHRCLCALRGWVFGLKLIGRNDLIAFGHMCIFVMLTATAVAHGRYFCGWICPIGLLQELFGRVAQRRRRLDDRRRLIAGYLTLVGLTVAMGWLAWLVRPRTQYLSENVAAMWGLAMLGLLFFVLPCERRDWAWGKLRYASALAWIGIAALGVFVTNPWCTLYGNEVDYSSFVSLLTVVSASMVVSMAWCRYLCPLGGLLAACATFARYRIVNDVAECDGCGQCEEICPVGALQPGKIDHGACIYCSLCIGHCHFRWQDRWAEEAEPALARGAGRVAGLWVVGALLGLLAAAQPVRAAGNVVEWPTFHYDNQRTGAPPVSFPSADFKLLWTYSLGKHTWRYCEGVSVWSASPVVAQVGGRMLVISGAYDHNVYAIDARTGEMVWRFTTGCVVNASPAFARVNGRPLVFVGSGDRCFYCLDARTGQKVWVRETMPWTFTVGESVPSAALVEEVGGEPVVFVAFWNSDKRPGRTIQRGDLYAFRAVDGKMIWQQKLTTGQISSPASIRINGRVVLYVGTEDGAVMAIDAATGQTMWTLLTDHAITNSPMVAKIAGRPVVFVGNFFGMIYCIHGRTGRVLWKQKLGHLVRSTPAFAMLQAGPGVFLGAFDRCLYALEAKTSRIVWRFATGKYITASPVAVRIAGRPAIVISSLDNFVYVVDALTCKPIWKFETGDMLWPYEKRGASLWSSPVVAHDGEKPLLIYGGHDGEMYCFVAEGEAAPQVASAGPEQAEAGAPAEQVRRRPKGWPKGFALWVPFVAGGLLVALGLFITLTTPPVSSEEAARGH